MSAEARFNPETAGPAEIQEHETPLAETCQAELKQSVDKITVKKWRAAVLMSSWKLMVLKDCTPETEIQIGVIALDSSVHILVQKQLGQAVDTRKVWQVVDIGKLEKAGKI